MKTPILVYPKQPESFRSQPAEKTRRNFFFEPIPVRADGMLDFGSNAYMAKRVRRGRVEEVGIMADECLD